MIKTIIFDIGGVITKDGFNPIYSGFAKRIGVPEDFVINYHKEKVADLQVGTISLDDFWNDMRAAGAQAELDLASIWIEEGTKNREINNELLAIIDDLRKDYRIATLTNLTELRFLMDEHINLYNHFDAAILSYKEGLRKPDPAFYHLALQKLGINAEEAIFIDDKEICIAPAEEIGIKSILYHYPNNQELLDNLSELGIKVKN